MVKKYESAYEYAKNADVSMFWCSLSEFDYDDEVIKAGVGSFSLSDPGVGCQHDYDDEIIEDGKRYISVNWGEDEKSYILAEEELTKLYLAYIREEDGFVSDGTVYETETAAQAAVDRYNEKTIIEVDLEDFSITIDGESCNFYEAGLYSLDPNVESGYIESFGYTPITDRDIIKEHLREKHGDDTKIVFKGEVK